MRSTTSQCGTTRPSSPVFGFLWNGAAGVAWLRYVSVSCSAKPPPGARYITSPPTWVSVVSDSVARNDQSRGFMCRVGTAVSFGLLAACEGCGAETTLSSDYLIH